MLGTVLVFYVPVYLLKAMRRVYAQSWWKTLPKFAILGLAYFVSLVFTDRGAARLHRAHPLTAARRRRRRPQPARARFALANSQLSSLSITAATKSARRFW